MIILITVLIIIMALIAMFSLDNDIFSLGIISISWIIMLIVIDVIAVIYSTIVLADGITAKEKIKMYQEENTKIEEQLDILVKQYMAYESETFKEFKRESSITLITMYPELKSDTLVKEQIKTYKTNNDKIKQLKAAQIDMKVGKWLLYFGG